MSLVSAGMLPVISILSFLLSVSCVVLSKTPLEVVYSHDIYSYHGISKSDVDSQKYSHYPKETLVIQDQNSMIPFIACGYLYDEVVLQNKIESIVDNTNNVQVAAIDYESKEICWHIHATLQQYNSLNKLSSDIVVQELPVSVKIHHSTYNFFDEFDRLSNHQRRETSTLEIKSVIDTEVVDLEGKAIVVNILPFTISTSELFDTLMETWERENAKEYKLPKVRQLSSTSQTVSSCKLSESISTEFHTTSVRLNDLRGWNLDCVLSFVEVAAQHPSVMSVAVEDRPVLLNYGARGVSQSGSEYYTPFSDAGVIGSGQIIGVTDSGLNDLSCFFYDNTGYYSSPKTTRSSSNSVRLESLRRKVVAYVSYADSTDAIAGHGTHVAGTVVGNSIFDRFGAGNGLAPGAKVAFFDVQAGDSPYLLIPDLSNYVFKSLYNAGARVMTNSWGSAVSGTYDDRSYQSDYFVYNNPHTR